MQDIEYVVEELRNSEWVPIYYADCKRACERFVSKLTVEHYELRITERFV
jgi:hypothetical protein